jgi:hypothetical protein
MIDEALEGYSLALDSVREQVRAVPGEREPPRDADKERKEDRELAGQVARHVEASCRPV